MHRHLNASDTQFKVKESLQLLCGIKQRVIQITVFFNLEYTSKERESFSFQWGMELSERSSNGNWFWQSPCDSLSCPSSPEVAAPEAGLFSRNGATSDSEAIREKVPRHGVLCGHTSKRRNDTQLLEPCCHRDYSLLAFYGQFIFRKSAKKLKIAALTTFIQNRDWIFTENFMTIAKNNWS